MQSEAQPKQQQFPCDQCGASMEFRPDLEALICPFCGHRQPLAASAAAQQLSETPPVQERDYHTFVHESQRLALLSRSALEVQCGSCQANITFEPPETAGLCPFCGTSIVAEPHEAHPLALPESVLPFGIGKRECHQAIQKWLGSHWFAPNCLKDLAQSERLQGVYLPFWTYDAQTQSEYRGERGDHYYETKTRTITNSEGKQITESYQEQHTRWRSKRGQVSRFFDDVLVPGIHDSVKGDRLQALAPWPLEQLVPYQSSYLAGFKVQRYQVDVEEGLAVAQGEMSQQIRQDVLADIGGDEQRVHSVDTQYRQLTFKHILLPLWISTYHYRNKQYQVVVNAQTGKVLGDRPYSRGKIALAILGVLGLIGLVVLIKSMSS